MGASRARPVLGRKLAYSDSQNLSTWIPVEPGKRTTVWYGGRVFLGRKRCAITRSPPYAAAKLTFS
jgi:hypothetical protein